MTNTIYLITGANRGIGRGLIAALLSRPNITVIAAVRNPDAESSTSLAALPKAPESVLIIVQIDSQSPTDAATAVETLQTTHNITHIDVVIANAAVGNDYSPVRSVPLSVVREHVETNAYGPLVLYQAVYPLLIKSAKPIFVGVGSAMGTIGAMEQRPFPSAAYGPSKAMLHWIVRKIHFEEAESGVVAFVADPGWVDTDMSDHSAKVLGVPKPAQAVPETVDGILGTIDGATRESVGGQWRVWDGSEFPW
ncbi:NAD(P)-binding protein [Aspergillus pseudodeflectus]|uniref:NAD(P)-binding protein n=1 Tax=Aspergillus pseudodeflectus TaxID=176178 RepID=A0ABR4K3Z2_9EURO